jgi:hypothetical protein
MLDFNAAYHSFKQRFEGNYTAFATVISNCLREEHTLIDSTRPESPELRRKNKQLECKQQQKIIVEISQSLARLRQEIALADGELRNVATQQHEFILKLNEISESIANVERQLKSSLPATTRKEMEDTKMKLDQTKLQFIVQNFQQRNMIAEKHIKLACSLATELKRVWAEVEKWQDEQKKSITGLTNPSEGTLDILDTIFDEGGYLLCQMVQQVTKAIEVCMEVQYSEDEKLEKLKIVLQELRSDYLVQHLHSAFVIDRHVDRVLKVGGGKSLGFSMSVRILGGSGLGLEFNPPSVKLSLFEERDIPESNDHREGFCQIYNGGERKFAVNRGTHACSAQFNSIQLKNVRRPDRGKNEELVTERKYAFVFYTTVSVCQEQVPLKAISLPVILTSQTSQEIMAKGTLVWDAAFSEQERKPFEYKEQVAWGEVANVLNALFLQNTGRGLQDDQLRYLARMAFRLRKDEDFDSKPITEKQVIRERLPNRDFSFWKWFWANMNLVKTYIQTEWKEGLIYGFISKDDAKRKLQDSPCGTFLLRFSETNIENSQKSDISGFLTLAVMEMDPKSGQKKLFHVKEYLSPKDLMEKGLAPILDAMEVADYARPGCKKRLLRYVYPDSSTTFESRFLPHIQQREMIDDGYKRGRYSIEIYLTDEQSRRHRQDSYDSDMSSAPSTPCVPSPQVPSEMSPASTVFYDADNGTEYDMTGMVDDFQHIMPLPTPQRQTAAVHPQVRVSPFAQNGQPVLEYSMLNQQPLFNSDEPSSVLFNDQDLAVISQMINSMPDAELHLGTDADNDMIVQNR